MGEMDAETGDDATDDGQMHETVNHGTTDEADDISD